jgi:hypothetical protein
MENLWTRAITRPTLSLLAAALSTVALTAGEFSPQFQKGVCLSHNHNPEGGYGTAEFRATLAALKELGATDVSLQPIGYSFNIHHPDIFGYRGEDLTLTEERLVQAIRDTKAAGFRVLLNPQLWIGVHWGVGDWRGQVEMTSDQDWEKWFQSYESFILYFARIAQSERVDLFSVGSELDKVTELMPERFRAVIRKVRSIYLGPCTYSANWGGEFERIPFWNDLEYLGISAYFPIGNGSLAARRSTAVKVRDHLAEIQRQTNKPILFLETGFQSEPDAGVNPSHWSWNPGVPADPQEQKLCYEAWLPVFWKEPWFEGAYCWQWFSDGKYDQQQISGYTFRSKPAADVISNLYKNGGR